MTFNTEALVEAGYIVVTVGHVYDSMLTVFPDGTVEKTETNDLSGDDKLELINKIIQDVKAA